MTFKQIQDEVILLAFDSSLRPSIKSWINQGYQWIWEQDDWDFKSVPFASFAVVAGNNAPTMPGDLAKVNDIYDSTGNPLLYLRQKEWEYAYLNPQNTTQQPSAYTVINRQVYLGPTPGASATYKISYQRKLSHVDAVNGIIGGVLVQDTDQTIWPAEHDYILVFDAAARGATLTNRLDAQSYVTERDRLLASMKNDLVLDASDQIEQWGSVWGARGY